jgi:hypothetical protein
MMIVSSCFLGKLKKLLFNFALNIDIREMFHFIKIRPIHAHTRARTRRPSRKHKDLFLFQSYISLDAVMSSSLP